MSEPGAPTKVAVLGGGVGAMAAAFELTRPELGGRFEVTVYQPGWRLGGKGASGRNSERGQRIEEHGLHVWFGFYENAFTVMRDAYEELAEKGMTCGPFATVWEAFEGCEDLIAFDRQGTDWVHLPFHIAPNPGHPGDGTAPRTFWEIAEQLAATELDRWSRLFFDRLLWNFWRPSLWRHLVDASHSARRADLDRFAGVADKVGVSPRRRDYVTGEHLLRTAHGIARHKRRGADLELGPGGAEAAFVDALNAFRDFIWDHFLHSWVADDVQLRFYFTTLDAWACGLRGLVADGVLEHGFDAINHLDLCEWLKQHGAKEITLGRTPAERCPFLRAIYDLAFAYEDGKIENANAAAGVAVSDLLRLFFSHSGYFVYKMQAGMGDTVFTPLYQVLKERGVTFRFFHAVTRLGLSADKQRVETIDVVEQAPLEPGRAEYEPLIDPHGQGDPWAWPNQPDWDQLKDGTNIRDRPGLLPQLEFAGNPLDGPTTTLVRGEAFDDVVLGISVGALAPLCGELMEHDERFRAAMEKAATTPTQGFQLWLRASTEALGWTHGTNSIAGAYVEPLDTYCDMSHLLPREAWPPTAGVSSIAYFCAVLDRRDETLDEATARVKASAREFLTKDIAPLWPTAVTSSGALRPELLVGDSPDRLDHQYYRANVVGSELYVISPAGTIDARVPSDASGFENLVLAGDWTKNGVDAGCVEAATLSGRQAARKLTGVHTELPGEHRAWLKTDAKPAYVEYGPFETSPGPFECTGGTFLGLVLQGDRARLSTLVDRVLNASSPDATRYRPLGSHVVLMVGHIDQIRSLAPGFSARGYAPEWQASVLLPLMAGPEIGGILLPDRIVSFLPYLLVDNSISLSGGREIYGFAKSLGVFEPGQQPGDWREQNISIQAFGGKFAPDQSAGWRELFSVRAVNRIEAELEAWDSVESFVRHHVRRAGQPEDADVAAGGLALPWRAIAHTFTGSTSQVCLRQFRDDVEPGLASSRDLITAPVRISSLSGRLSPHRWVVDITRLDSHPLLAELGLDGQPVSFAFELEMDFVLG